MQPLISNNSCLGKLSFHIRSFMKSLGGKSDITGKGEEKLLFCKKKLKELKEVKYLLVSCWEWRQHEDFLSAISWAQHWQIVGVSGGNDMGAHS